MVDLVREGLRGRPQLCARFHGAPGVVIGHLHCIHYFCIIIYNCPEFKVLHIYGSQPTLDIEETLGALSLSQRPSCPMIVSIVDFDGGIIDIIIDETTLTKDLE